MLWHNRQAAEPYDQLGIPPRSSQALRGGNVVSSWVHMDLSIPAAHRSCRGGTSCTRSTWPAFNPRSSQELRPQYIVARIRTQLHLAIRRQKNGCRNGQIARIAPKASANLPREQCSLHVRTKPPALAATHSATVSTQLNYASEPHSERTYACGSIGGIVNLPAEDIPVKDSMYDRADE